MRIDALSVRRLLAVALAYVVLVRWAGIAEAGDVDGNGWLKWITCEFELCEWWFVFVWLLLPPEFGATVCIVVSVVVSDLTDGAGEEKVLSPPLRPLAVRLVPASDDSPWEGASIERTVSCSVETVGAIERPPVVGGGRSSLDDLTESDLPREDTLADRRLGPEDSEYWLGRGEMPTPMQPDCG